MRRQPFGYWAFLIFQRAQRAVIDMRHSIGETDRPVNQRFGRTHLQVLIDTNTDSPAEMRALARILTEAADAATEPTPQTGVDDLIRVGITPVLEIKTDAPPPPPPPPPTTPVVPVAAATVITAATAPVSSTDAGALIDSAGVKWDYRLHTSTKTKDIDGKWKARKSREAPVPLHPATVPAGTSAPPPPPPPPVPPSVTQMPVPPPPPSVMVPSAEPSDDDINVESDTAAPSESTGVSQGTAPVGLDFASFIARLTSGMNDGSITQVRVAEVQKELGIVSLFSLGDTEAAKLQDAVKAFGFTL